MGCLEPVDCSLKASTDVLLHDVGRDKTSPGASADLPVPWKCSDENKAPCSAINSAAGFGIEDQKRNFFLWPVSQEPA